MLSTIPSWAVALTGAIILIIGTVVNSILLYQNKKRIIEARSEAENMQVLKDRAWGQHLLAEQRYDTATLMELIHEAAGNANPPLLKRTISRLRGAVLAMWNTQEKIREDPTKGSEEAVHVDYKEEWHRLESAYGELKDSSVLYINQINVNIKSIESERIKPLERCELLIYISYVFFNFLGLLITMCKDLPIWK